MKKSTIARIIAIVMVIMSLLTVVVTACAERNIPRNAWAYANRNGVNIRQTASKTSTLLKTINIGTPVLILETTSKSQGWYKVRYQTGVENIVGYIREDMLTKTAQGNTSYAQYYGTTTLKEGMSNSYVRTMICDLKTWADNNKSRLASGEYNNYFAGILNNGQQFTSDVKQAVMIFQRVENLVVDGLFGKNSMTKLCRLVHGC